MGGAATQAQMAQIIADPNSLPAVAAQVGAVPEPGQVAASLLLLAGIGVYVFLKRRRTVATALTSSGN
jgi:hypothetical protein